jgi:hypothetical protein
MFSKKKDRRDPVGVYSVGCEAISESSLPPERRQAYPPGSAQRIRAVQRRTVPKSSLDLLIGRARRRGCKDLRLRLAVPSISAGLRDALASAKADLVPALFVIRVQEWRKGLTQKKAKIFAIRAC